MKKIELSRLEIIVGGNEIDLLQMYYLFYSEKLRENDSKKYVKASLMMYLLYEYGIWDNDEFLRRDLSFVYWEDSAFVEDELSIKKLKDLIISMYSLSDLEKNKLYFIDTIFVGNFDKDFVSGIGKLIDYYCNNNGYDKLKFLRILTSFLYCRDKDNWMNRGENRINFNTKFLDDIGLKKQSLENFIVDEMGLDLNFILEDDRKLSKAREFVIKNVSQVKKMVLKKN